MHVDDHRVGLVADPMAVLLDLKGPRDVLEPGQLLVVGMRRPHRGPHRAVGVVAEGVGLIGVRLGGKPPPHDLQLGKGAALVAGLPSVDEGRIAVRLQRRGQALEPVLVGGIDMGAGEHQKLARGGGAADIEGPSEGEGRRRDRDHARPGALGEGHRVVGRARIDDDDFLGLAGLASESVEQRGQVSGLVQGADDDGHGAHGGRSPSIVRRRFATGHDGLAPPRRPGRTDVSVNARSARARSAATAFFNSCPARRRSSASALVARSRSSASAWFNA